MSIKVVITREDEHHFTGKIVGYPSAVVHRIKKATTAIGLLAINNKKLFGIRETQYALEGLAVIEQKGKHGTFASLNGRPDIEAQYADSFETALGQLIKHNQKEFDVEIEHIGR